MTHAVAHPTPTAQARCEQDGNRAHAEQARNRCALVLGQHPECEQDDGRRQAVVEPALHVQCPPNPRRDNGIEHGRRPEAGVGGGDRRGDEQRTGQPEFGQHPA